MQTIREQLEVLYEQNKQLKLTINKMRREASAELREKRRLVKLVEGWQLASDSYRSDLHVCRTLLKCDQGLGKPCKRIPTSNEQEEEKGYSLP